MDVHARESGSPMRSNCGSPLTKVGAKNSLRPAEVEGFLVLAGGILGMKPLFRFCGG